MPAPTSLNVLAPTTDINAAINYFTKNGHAIRPELFYNKMLLDTIRLGAEHFVHYRLADLKPIQNKASKLQLRRWSALNAHTVPLVEGMPPRSDKGAMESFELGVHQYGRYMEFTDKVSWEIIDPIISHYTQQYSIVAMETLDILAREALMNVPNKYYAGMAANLSALQIGTTARPSLNDLRIIILGMKKRLVKPRSGRNYHVIGTPNFTFDMITDPLVEKYFTINNTTKSAYSDSVLPALFEMEFYETMHTDNSAEFTKVVAGAASKTLRVFRRLANGTYEYKDVDEKNASGVATGYYVEKKDFYRGDGNRFPNEELNAIPSAFVWDLDKFNTDQAATDNPYVELNVEKVLVIGKDALIRTDVAGEGNAKMYAKPLGSAGTLDPINQRQSIGFKINAVGFGVENNAAVAIYNCLPSQANA